MTTAPPTSATIPKTTAYKRLDFVRFEAADGGGGIGFPGSGASEGLLLVGPEIVGPEIVGPEIVGPPIVPAPAVEATTLFLSIVAAAGCV